MIDHLRWKFIRDTWFNYRSNRIGGLDCRSLRRTVTGGLSTSTRGASRGVVRSRPGVSTNQTSPEMTAPLDSGQPKNFGCDG